MQVILLEDLENLGAMGEIVHVRPGYARNYLFPRKLAQTATTGQVRQLAHQRRMVEDKRRKRMSQYAELARQLSAVQIDIAKKVGENDMIFGTVTNADIAEALAQRGYDIDRRKITIDEPIRSLGLFTVTIRLSAEVSAHVKVQVVAEPS